MYGEGHLRREFSDGEGYIEARETPMLVALGLFLSSGFTGGAEWSIYCHQGGAHRPILLERVDSQYAAEQALKRWQERVDRLGLAKVLKDRWHLRLG